MPEEPKLLLETARFRVVEHEIRLGSSPEPLRRQVVVHPGAVTILPLLEGGQVCLIRNFRIAVGDTLVELPAGTLEPGEAPQTTAVRELREETGYEAESWRALPPFFMSPGILNERMHIFAAEGLTAGDPQREVGEQIENFIVPWDEALAMIDRGDIQDAKTIAGLLLWDRLRGR